MTTALSVIQQAFATSRYNVIGRTAATPELLDMLNADLAAYFTEGSQLNRRFFGARVNVAFDHGGWSRPARVGTIYRLEAGSAMPTAGTPLTIGDEVIDLSFDQRTIEQGRPAVTNFGQQWITAGRAADPVSGTLVVFAAKLPTILTAETNELDPLWPDVGVPLLKWGLALYLAQKDGERDAEVAAFTAQQAIEKKRFLDFVTAETTTEIRDYGFGTSFAAPSITPR